MHKVIRSEEQYAKALRRIETLMSSKAGTIEGDELDLLATLVEDYEQRQFPTDLPDPIAAIKFRMDQAGLRQKDLIPFIGSRSKVSEVLNGKRPLSLPMIRSLHQGLGIPAEVLLRQPGACIPEPDGETEWTRFPVVEMAKRGWFPGFKASPVSARDCAEELVMSLVDRLPLPALQPAFLRQHIRSGATLDDYALRAWQIRVLLAAQDQDLPDYNPQALTKEFMAELVRLSYLDSGPRLAKEFLAKNGIALVTLTHLPRTHLDGAAMVSSDGNPIVALTLRYDRLDHFWFTLCHELGHVALHLFDSEGAPDFFADDLSVAGDALETAADEFATVALLSKKEWKQFMKREQFDPASVRTFADALRVGPAVIAGRIRRELDNYRILSGLVGLRQLRCQFENLEGSLT